MLLNTYMFKKCFVSVTDFYHLKIPFVFIKTPVYYIVQCTFIFLLFQPAAAYAWHQPMSPGQTPVSPDSDRHSQPPTPCLTPRSLPSQVSICCYTSSM